MMDCDFELDCGCIVGWNHGAWDWDLTYVDECREGHTKNEAIELAEAVR